MGSMTGRGAGYCVGFKAPGFVNRGGGFDRGAGCGAGLGFRARMGRGRGVNAPRFGFAERSGGQKEQVQLKNQAEALKTQLDAVQQRLSELEKAD